MSDQKNDECTTKTFLVPSLKGGLILDYPEVCDALMKIYAVFGWDYDGDAATIISEKCNNHVKVVTVKWD